LDVIFLSQGVEVGAQRHAKRFFITMNGRVTIGADKNCNASEFAGTLRNCSSTPQNRLQDTRISTLGKTIQESNMTK
jgi:hypothetical protein